MTRITHDFTLTTPVRVAGLVVGEVDVRLRAYIDLLPEPVVRWIEVFGRLETGVSWSTFATLPDNDPLWERANSYLIRNHPWVATAAQPVEAL